MLASRSYDGMTVSLKLWGEEERKGDNFRSAHGFRITRGSPVKEYSQSYDQTKNAKGQIGAHPWQLLSEITPNLLAARS